jgi:hypothetical protein
MAPAELLVSELVMAAELARTAAPDKAMEKAPGWQVWAAARFEGAEGMEAANLHAAAAKVAVHLG